MSEKLPILPSVGPSPSLGETDDVTLHAESYGSGDISTDSSRGTNGMADIGARGEDGKAPASPETTKKFKNNRYATKKTAGQGLLGVSLITSNTAQLKSTIEDGPESEYFTLILSLLVLSLVLQLVVGILLMIIGARESKLQEEANKSSKKTEKFNDISTFLIFIVTVVNAALGAFSISPSYEQPGSDGFSFNRNSTV